MVKDLKQLLFIEGIKGNDILTWLIPVKIEHFPIKLMNDFVNALYSFKISKFIKIYLTLWTNEFVNKWAN